MMIKRLGLILLRKYDPAITITWNGQTLWADSIWVDAKGIKRYSVKGRDRVRFYPRVNDCELEKKGE